MNNQTTLELLVKSVSTKDIASVESMGIATNPATKPKI